MNQDAITKMNTKWLDKMTTLQYKKKIKLQWKYFVAVVENSFICNEYYTKKWFWKRK